jgi:VWFA-related protein
MQTDSQFSVYGFQFSVRASCSRLLIAACCLLLSLGCFSIARAQDDVPPPPPQPTPPPQSVAQQQTTEAIETIRVDTDLVDLHVQVLGRDPQRPVGELQQKDFRVFENGEPQEIAFFASSATPFDLVLLLDLSGSTVDKLDLVRKSARRFVEAARPVDRISVVTFANVPRLVSPLTFDRAALIEQINKIGKPRGGTNFWDALSFVLSRVVEKQPEEKRRSAVVVMTDGVDNALPDVPGDGSATSFPELIESVRKSESIVLPIYLDTEPEMVREHRWFDVENTFLIARRQLELLASESGSLLYRARRLEDLKGIYEQVIRDLGMVYSIGYSPTNKRRDGSWRTISVQFPARPELNARTRRGYFAR